MFVLILPVIRPLINCFIKKCFAIYEVNDVRKVQFITIHSVVDIDDVTSDIITVFE